jgi:hypothetical protein
MRGERFRRDRILVATHRAVSDPVTKEARDANVGPRALEARPRALRALVRRAESRVLIRTVLNAICGQSFGFSVLEF